jgi:hypothetical protein
VIGELPSIDELLDPRNDTKRQVMQFFARGQSNVCSVSRPTLHGMTASKDVVDWFFELLDRTEAVRRQLADALERQAIRARILEPDPRLGKLGLIQDRA